MRKLTFVLVSVLFLAGCSSDPASSSSASSSLSAVPDSTSFFMLPDSVSKPDIAPIPPPTSDDEIGHPPVPSDPSITPIE